VEPGDVPVVQARPRRPGAGRRRAGVQVVEPADPEDVANALLFLLSDESRYITSVALPVDAGNTQR
jgi:NAD(P)-dependent dehydrogenase (short-subunit alcohol dehydrogenase family)